MREKDTFTKRISYEYNQLDTITEYLEEKAIEGWELTSKSGAIWGFRKAEPRRVKFNVELMDQGVTGKALDEFISFCEADGWKHSFDAGNIQIFENEDLEAKPIHTDPAVKLAIVHEKCKAVRLLIPVVSSIVLLFMTWKIFFPLDIYFFESTRNISNMLAIPTLSVILLLSAVDYIKWYIDAKRAIDRGEDPKYKKSGFSKIIEFFLIAVLFLNGIVFNLLDTVYNGDWELFKWLVAIIVITFVGFVILFPKLSAKYNKTKVSNGLELALLAIVLFVLLLIIMPMCVDDSEKNLEPPFTLETLGICDTKEDEIYINKRSSPLLAHYEYSEDTSKDIYLDYRIYITSVKKAYDAVVDYWTVPNELDYEIYEDPSVMEAVHNYYEVDEPGYKAEKVLYNEFNDRLLLLYKDRVIKLDVSVELTEAQKSIIAEKLLAVE